jgi:3D (Asp-Asp-Asp) domain-containing protein
VRADPITPRTRWLVIAACSALAVAVALPASGAGGASALHQRAAELARENGTLATRSRAAVLTLYGLDSGLARAQAELAALQRETSALARRRVETRRELAVARRLVRRAQQNLADRLRAVYEHGDSDPLAVVIGASSLDDALSGIDTLNAAAASDRRLVGQATRARRTYLRLQRRLASRAAKLRRLEAAAAARANALAAAKAERAAYIQQLARSRRLNTSQIGGLESQARAIGSQAQQVAVEQTALAAPAPAAATPVAGSGHTLTVLATAYTLRGRTATGAPVGYGVVAVDPSVIPLGTRMTIPGYGEGVAADTGGSVRGAVIDLWFPSAGAAAAWGRRSVTITLH